MPVSLQTNGYFNRSHGAVGKGGPESRAKHTYALSLSPLSSLDRCRAAHKTTAGGVCRGGRPPLGRVRRSQVEQKSGRGETSETNGAGPRLGIRQPRPVVGDGRRRGPQVK